MDTATHIINLHNPNKEGKHPHLIQKGGGRTTTHTNKTFEEKQTHPTLVALKDWKINDIELFASMGFSAEKHGEDGYYMEEDILPIGDGEPQNFVRRISRTKDHKWILEKKSRENTQEDFKLEKRFNQLMGTENNPGLLDYFDTLTDKLTERLYLYKHMKLKTILENLPPAAPLSPLKQDVTQVSNHGQAEDAVINRGLSKEQKKLLQELVMEYNRYNEVLEMRKKLMEVATKMANIGNLAEAYLTEKLHEGNNDENAWFEEKTIRRNTSEIKKLAAEFKKSATDCGQQMKGMQTMYKECGMLLERYFNME